MKRFAIASLVGALVIFVVQSLSWMVLGVHDDSMKYTPQQDSIMAALNSAGLEEGAYFLPNCPPDIAKDQTKAQEFMQTKAGQPWAFVTYHKSLSMEMGPAMIKGFLLNLAAVMLAVWLLMGLGAERLGSFGQRWLAVMAIAGVALCTGSLMNANWWETPMHWLKGEVIDLVLAWGACGAWLAWYLGRR